MSDAILDIAREARVAALAGFAWILAIWIALRPGIDPEISTSATAVAIARLSGILGNVGGLFVLFLVALGLGTVSLQVFRAPAIWVANLSTLIVRSAEALIVKLLAWPRKTAPKLRRYSEWEPVAVDLARRIIHEHRRELDGYARTGEGQNLEQALYYELDRAKHQELPAMRISATSGHSMTRLICVWL